MVKLDSVLRFAKGDERFKRVHEFPATVYAKTASGLYLAGNDFISSIAGLSSVPDLLEKTDKELCWSASYDRLHANDVDVMKRQESLLRIEPVIDFQGRSINMMSFKMPIKGENDESVGVLGISLDPNQSKASDFFDMVSQMMYCFDTELDFTKIKTKQEVDRQKARDKLLNALTPRERECVKCLFQGMSAKETAQVLGLSFRTVEVYFEKIKSKLGVRKKSEIIHLLYGDDISKGSL